MPRVPTQFEELLKLPSDDTRARATWVYETLRFYLDLPTDVRTARLQQWTYGGGNNLKWRVEDLGGGYFRLTSISSGKVAEVAEVAGSSKANGAAVQQWDWANSDNQRWSLTPQSDGSYQVLNKTSGKAMDVSGVSTADGADIQQWDWSGSGGSNQKWLFTDLGTTARTALATAGPAADARLQVYPTILNKELTFDYTAATAESLQVQLVDALGRVALASPAVAVRAGFNHVGLDVTAASPGLYVLKVRTATGPLSQRVIIVR